MSEETLKPRVALLAKLGSIAVHADEMLPPDGHAFDRVALGSLLTDAEVTAWLTEMRELSLVPRKRS